MGGDAVADVQYLTYGLTNPLLATGLAALGGLLGLILATNALGHTGRARRRLLVYAAFALGGSGVWVPSLVALLGFSAPDSPLRYAPQPLAASFGVAVVGVGVGLMIICTGRMRFVRLLLGGIVIGATIAATDAGLLMSLRVGGTIGIDRNLFVAAVGAAMITAATVTGLLAGLRRLWVAGASAVLLALDITATHYLMLASVRVRLGVEHAAIMGITPILLLAAAIMFGTTVITMLWFFTVGTATRSDLRAVFATPHRPIDIEPWMIEEVTARIAIGTSLVVDEPSPPARRSPRPTPGIGPSWRSMPAWGSAAMATNGRTNRSNTRTTVGWVDNSPILVEPAMISSTVDEALDAALLQAARVSEYLDRATASTVDSPVSTAAAAAEVVLTEVRPEGETSPEPDAAPSDPETPDHPTPAAPAAAGATRWSRWRNRRR
jgi:NO-binding membrane sensor protein with MHYT domain